MNSKRMTIRKSMQEDDTSLSTRENLICPNGEIEASGAKINIRTTSLRTTSPRTYFVLRFLLLNSSIKTSNVSVGHDSY